MLLICLQLNLNWGRNSSKIPPSSEGKLFFSSLFGRNLKPKKILSIIVILVLCELVIFKVQALLTCFYLIQFFYSESMHSELKKIQKNYKKNLNNPGHGDYMLSAIAKIAAKNLKIYNYADLDLEEI